ncbi:MAG: RHS repeat-associated core domain-containing protein [Nannocystaceae bacterium]
MESPGGLVREFGPIRGEATDNRDRGMARLTRIRNRGGDAIELRYDNRARLSEVVDSGRRRIRFDHDRNGRLEYIWLPAANGDGLRQHARFFYSPEGDLVETQDAAGKRIRFEYAEHTLVRETDRNGLSFYFEYDGWGPFARCTRTWGDGQIHDHAITYDIKGRRTIVEDSIGYATVYEWGAHGTVTKIIDARGGETHFRYDGLTRKTAEIDPLGNATRTMYDERGNVVMVAGPEGTATKIRYDEHDNPIWLSTPKGAQWQWTYDRWGRRVSEIDPLGHCTRYHYEHGRMVAVENPVGARTSLGYDASGNVVQLVNPDGTQRQWSYDALGRMVSATDPVGNVQRRDYDALGRVVRVDEPDGNVRQLEYDPEGNVVRARDKLRQVELGYCGMGKVAWRTIAGTTVRFEYDTEERLTAFINEKGYAYRFERDAIGNVRVEECYDGSKRKYERDAAGRVTKVRRPGIGRWSTFEYDTSGRTTKVAHYDGTEEVFAYDADGGLVEANNSTTTVRFERDLLGRVVKEWQGEHWVASHYDHQGLRIGMESSLGARQTITRNVMGDVVGLIAKQGEQTWEAKIVRDALGLEVDRQLPGGARSYWWRDQLGRPIQHRVGTDNKIVRGRGYRWGLDQTIDEIVEHNRGGVRYLHNTRGDLVSTTSPDGDIEYRTSDDVGNLFRTADRSDRDFGPSGELRKERILEGVRKYRHDPERNLVAREDPDGHIWRFDWNGADQLASIQHSAGLEASFEYDALGRRMSKTVGQQATTWIWDGDSLLHELLDDELTTWIFDPERFSPAARLHDECAYSIISDHIGTPLCVLDEDGELCWHADVDAWGKVSSIGDGELCPWRFPGQYQDEETGLHYNRFRYYDPDGGQYLSEDPIGIEGGSALRAYVRDPTTWIDPLGLTARRDYANNGARANDIVLGQNMPERVIPAAERLDAGWLKLDPADWTWEKNRQFLWRAIRRVRAEKGQIFDIGGQRGRYQGPKAIYSREKALLERNDFERRPTGRWIMGTNGRKFRVYEWIEKI